MKYLLLCGFHTQQILWELKTGSFEAQLFPSGIYIHLPLRSVFSKTVQLYVAFFSRFSAYLEFRSYTNV